MTEGLLMDEELALALTTGDIAATLPAGEL
jgi:hypothetical protein